MKRSLVKFSGLENYVTKKVTVSLRMTKVAMFASFEERANYLNMKNMGFCLYIKGNMCQAYL